MISKAFSNVLGVVYSSFLASCLEIFSPSQIKSYSHILPFLPIICLLLYPKVVNPNNLHEFTYIIQSIHTA